MKKLLMLTFTLLVSASLLAGCNTIGGAGEDIEKGGEAIQDSAS
ncbi:entericidin A/B family lipoprotein [Halomonas sp. PR-M31]|nr:entericidin A/B family lipoprotein [Halomonas sp. PR-M31]